MRLENQPEHLQVEHLKDKAGPGTVPSRMHWQSGRRRGLPAKLPVPGPRHPGRYRRSRRDSRARDAAGASSSPKQSCRCAAVASPPELT